MLYLTKQCLILHYDSYNMPEDDSNAISSLIFNANEASISQNFLFAEVVI